MAYYSARIYDRLVPTKEDRFHNLSREDLTALVLERKEPGLNIQIVRSETVYDAGMMAFDTDKL